MYFFLFAKGPIYLLPNLTPPHHINKIQPQT